jgi:hypothetical protein
MERLPTDFYLFIPAEFLGFNNKTCDAGVPPMSQTYGNTVGPLIRQASGDSKLWRWWEVKMTSKISSNGAPMATIKNIFPSNKGKPKCLGHYITDYYHYKNKEACTELPWAERVHLHAESRPWEFQAVPGTDCFNIIDDAKPDGCLKFLSASASCSEKYVHLAAGDDGSGLQRWRLVGYKGPPPAPPAKSPPRAKSPPPPLRSKSPPPPPKPKAVAPLLISVSASSPTTGSVVFQPTAGASSCNVTVSKDGQTVTRTITSLNYPFTNFYAAGLASDTDYTVKVLCELPSGATLPAPVDGTLHTPPNSGHPAVINVVPTSGTSGNITIVPPDALVCKAKLYEVKATPKAGGATQTFTSTSLNVALTGLTSGVQYSIIVDAICDDGSTTKPSDPIYFTPLKSAQTPSSPPPPLAKPSPPLSPGLKAPPAVKPPSPPLEPCTEAPTVGISAVNGPLITFNVGIPRQVKGTTYSELAYGVGCTYPNGTDAGSLDNLGNNGTATWLPATDPKTTFQVYIREAATCELIVAVQQLGQSIPVVCGVGYKKFTIQDLYVTPSILISTDPTPANEAPIIQIIKPLKGCDNMSYIVSSTAPGGPALPLSADEITQPFGLLGFAPGSQITVQGVCPDGSKTPTSTPPSIIPPCIVGTSFDSSGLCVALSSPPPPPVPCQPGQYNNGGVCTTCSSSLTNCAVVAPCTATADSTCTQCAVGWLLKNSTCLTKDPCVSAAAGANIQGGNVGYSKFVPFTNPAGVSGGNFPPGTYEVRYVDGCMTYGPYGPGQKWTVSAGNVVGSGAIDWYGWFVGTGLNDKLARAPGAFGYTGCGSGLTPGEGCGFESAEACIAYSKTQPSGVAIQVPAIVTLTTAAPLGVWLQDTPNQYGDNVASDSGPPSWSVRLQGCTS